LAGRAPVVRRSERCALAARCSAESFFATGESVLRHADIFRRLVREGHAASIHTFSHIDFDEHRSTRDRAELVATDRVMRTVAGYGTRLFRLPYGDEDTNPLGIALAQQMGYLHVGYDVDTGDWHYRPGDQIPVPAPGRPSSTTRYVPAATSGDRSIGYTAEYARFHWPRLAPTEPDSSACPASSVTRNRAPASRVPASRNASFVPPDG
jgi:hypothetical protein